MASRLCPFCMKITGEETCPHCGKHTDYTGQPMHLPAGYVVSGTHPYVLGAALGQGGFGITYIALDMITNQRVAIKEYFPTHCSGRTDHNAVTAYSNQEEVYLKGKERFLEEARTLKSLSDLNSIVNVLDFFEANNSAYLVMEFLEGSSLKEYAAKNGKFPAQKFLAQIRPLMEDIHRMHERGVIHRDIAPDNIILLPDGQMKLIDFGSARSYLGDKSMTVVVKKGFAPVEQYMSKGSSASTDVYALAATIYYCITGKVPPDSAERQYDGIPLVSPGSLGADISLKQEKALTKALEIHQKDRIQSVQKLLESLKEKESIRQKNKLIKPKSKQADPKPAPNLSAPVKSASTAADAVPVPEKKLKDAKKPDEKSVQSIQDRRSEQKIIQKSIKPDHKKKDEPTPPGKKTTLKIAAVILVVITVAGFVLTSRKPKETEEQRTAVLETTEAPTEATLPMPTEAAVEEPAWKKNVLMADVSYDEDTSRFWADRDSATSDEISDYFSQRHIFNMGIPRSNISDVFFLDSLSTAPEKVYDVSAGQDGSVLAWTEENKKGALDLYIAGDGGVNGEKACRALFRGYTELESVQFNRCFFTDTTQDMSNMFSYCKKLQSIELESLNTSNATDMSYLFEDCELLPSLDLGNFDTAKVTNMRYMFRGCNQLTSLNLSNFDTTSVTDMEGMFSGCDQLTSLDLSSFDTTKATDMRYMFHSCNRLVSLDLSNFDTASVTDMEGMFGFCKQLTSLDLSSFNTVKVTDMSDMFYYCEKLTSLDLSNFDTSNVESYERFMENGKKVNGRPWKELFDQNKEDPSVESTGEELAWKNNVLMADVTFDEDYTRFWNEEFKKFSYEIYDFFAKRPVFNTDIPRKKVTDVFFLDSIATAPETVYDVSANQDGSVLAWTEKNRKGALNLYIAGEGGVNGEEACRSLFYGYEELTSINFNDSFFTDTTQDLSAMFGYCKKLETIELGSLNTESATNMSMMFSNCESLKSLDLSTFNTSNVTDMSSMFSGCQKLKTIDISSFDTSNVENMSHMFSYLKNMKAFDVSNFDTSKVTNMNGLFSGCSNEKFTALDLSNFDTSKVTNMSSMFSGCQWITSLDLTNFDTSKVTNMQSMFYYCRRLTSLDLSSFDTSNVAYMNSMFEMCSMLPVLEISHFNTAKVISMGHMFYKCGYLKKMDVTQFDVTSVKNTENMFFGCDKLPLDYKKLGGKYIWSS